MKKIVATIEARMTSSRLPGKVLLPAAGRPMLAHLLDRLKSVKEIDEIVLATTVNKIDDPLVDFAKRAGVSVFRGDEEDVMGRVIGAAKKANADIVVEITADCPLIDPDIISQAINTYLQNPCDYLSNVMIRSYPDGMDVQVFPLSVLEDSAGLTQDHLDREHVSLYIRNHPEKYKQIHLLPPQKLYWPELGLTLDDMADYELIKKIMEHFHQHNKAIFSCGDILELLHKNKEWLEINAHVKRKGNS